jgi:peptidoglycan/xylan/chitin deacetylase (PgdA/CDA1 family)
MNLSIQKHKTGILYSAIFAALCLCAATATAATTASDSRSAVIFVYQRVGEDTPSRGGISTAQFQEHIEALKNGGFSVLPLPVIVDALKNGTDLPAHAVALTFDGGWKSTLQNAIPLLNKANMPYTVFFASDMPDSDNATHMSWRDLKKLKKNKLATLGILPASYVHMADLGADDNAAYINKAVSRYRAEYGEDPAYFAYPYGEYSAAVEQQVSTYPFKAAFGQQSGVSYAGQDMLALPRFIMTDTYGDIDRFLLTAGALPLPVSDMTPADMMVRADANPPAIGFTVTPELQNLSGLDCFASGIGKLELKKPDTHRIEIRLAAPLQDKRTRINCTMQDDTVIPGQAQAWRWMGMLLTLPGNTDDAPLPDNTDTNDAQDMDD